MNIDHLTSRDELLKALRNDALRGDILWDCRKRIVEYLRSQLSPEDVEDLASDCVEILQRGKLEHWQSERSKLSTFVIGIARNKLCELFRRSKRQPINVSPVSKARSESEEDFVNPLERLSALRSAPEDHLNKYHPRLFSAEYVETWQEILQLCDSLCTSPHEKRRLQELVSKMSITPEKVEAFLAGETRGEGWPQVDLTPGETALILRVLQRLESEPTSTIEHGQMDDEAGQGVGRLDLVGGRMEFARFRAEVWRYWASAAGQGQIEA